MRATKNYNVSHQKESICPQHWKVRQTIAVEGREGPVLGYVNSHAYVML